MNRPLMIIALLLAVMGAVFLIANFGGSIALYLFAAAIVLVIVGVLTGK